MLSQADWEDELAKVLSIVDVLPVSGFAKLISAETTIYAFDLAKPLLQNYYTIADAYAYCHTCVTSQLAHPSILSKEKAVVIAKELEVCYRTIAMHYHHVPTQLFNDIFDNRAVLFRKLIIASDNYASNIKDTVDAFLNVLLYDTSATDYYDVSSGKLPLSIIDFYERVTKESHVVAATHTYTRAINHVIGSGKEIHHSNPSKKPSKKTKAKSSKGRPRMRKVSFWGCALLIDLEVLLPCLALRWPTWIAPAIITLLIIIPVKFVSFIAPIFSTLWLVAWGFGFYYIFQGSFPTIFIVIYFIGALIRLCRPNNPAILIKFSK